MCFCPSIFSGFEDKMVVFAYITVLAVCLVSSFKWFEFLLFFLLVAKRWNVTFGQLHSWT